MPQLIRALATRPRLLLVFATFFWGSNFVLSRALVDTIPPLFLSTLRWTIAFLVFVPIAWHEWKKYRHVLVKHKGTIFCLALTGISGYNTFIYIAVQHTTSINASIVNATAPLVIILLSVLFLRERLTLFQYGGVCLSFFGVLWVLTEGRLNRLLDFTFNAGDLIVFLGVGSWAIYSIVMKKWGAELPKKATFLTTIALGTIILFPFMVWESMQISFHIQTITVTHWFGIIYLGIFPSVIAFMCWNEGVFQIGPGKSSNMLYLMIVFAGVMAIFIGEVYTFIQFIGAVLIVSGVLLVSNQQMIVSKLKHISAKIRRKRVQ